MIPEIISITPANDKPYPMARPITYDTMKKKRMNPIIMIQVLRLFEPMELYIVMVIGGLSFRTCFGILLEILRLSKLKLRMTFLKCHFHFLFVSFICFEEFFLGKSKFAGYHIGWKHLNFLVIV